MKSFRRRRDRAAHRQGQGWTRTRPSFRVEGLEDRVVLSFAPIPGEVFLTGPNAGAPMDVALAYLARSKDQYGLTDLDLARYHVVSANADTIAGGAHIYLRQGLDGLEVQGADLSIHISARGEVIAVGDSFSPVVGGRADAALPAPTISAAQAIELAAAGLGYDVTKLVTTRTGEPNPVDPSQRSTFSVPLASSRPVTPYLAYDLDADGSPKLSWIFDFWTPSRPNEVASAYDAVVDASTGEVRSLFDRALFATYNVVAPPNANPLDGGRTLVVDPHLQAPEASPFGWHDTDGANGAEFTDTRGNNTFSQEDTNGDDAGGIRPDGGTSLVFDFPFDQTQGPSSYTDAATANLFFATNHSHDVHYYYGFDEAAGNFQFNNYSKGGTGNDQVFADAQDGSFTNNAVWIPAAEGQSPRTEMYAWTFNTPQRDGSFDNEVMFHEYGHGVSTRLVMGPANVSVLRSAQGGALGEGWSDTLSLYLTQKTTDKPGDAYSVGSYIFPGGVRRFPYSFDTSIFPLGYANTSINEGVHSNGEIWAATLWDMNWLIQQSQPFQPDWFQRVDLSNPEASGGNQIALQLVLQGMKLVTVANPTFLEARDAILKADTQLFGGKYAPAIWGAFARRGMGMSARDLGGTDAWDVQPATDIPNFVELDYVGPQSARENRPLTDIVVAQLTDRSGLGTPDEYNVTVDWGDGRGPLVAQIRDNGAGGYDVVSSVEYDEGGDRTVTIRADRTGSLPTIITDTISVISDDLVAQPGGGITAQEDDPTQRYLLANFRDYDPDTNPVTHYKAEITWGDGSTSLGQLTQLPDGTFDVFGTHSFGEGGTYVTSVKISETWDGGNSTSVGVQAKVASAPIVVSGGYSYVVTEGTTLSNVVANFVDQDKGANGARNYKAVIDWGDGTSSDGDVVATGGNNFRVVGNHTFRRGQDGLSSLPIRVTVTEKGGNTGSAQSSASVSDAPIAAQPVQINTSEGPFSGVVARFIDSNILGTAGEYTAQVDFGDGSAPVAGKVRAGSDGLFEVVADHSYRVGSYNLSVKVVAVGVGGSTSSTTSTAFVTDAPIAARGLPIVAPEGPFTGRVASFTDKNPAGQASEFTAVIDWGNGQSSPGVVSADPLGGFVVTGSTNYAVGAFPISVTILSKGGSKAATKNTATIADAPLTGAALAVETTEVTPKVLNVATVADTYVGGKVSDLIALINWGDGTTSAGQIITTPAGVWVVQASKSYGQSGNYTIQTTVTSLGGSTVSVVGVAAVGVLAVPVTGGLDASTDSGASASDGLTSSQTLRFVGQAAPGSTVELTARGPRGTISLGSVLADSSGSWAVNGIGLTDGSYTLVASATNKSGRPSSPSVELNAGKPLVVDTSSPGIRDVFLDARRGQVRLTVADAGSGLNSSTLADPALYKFADVNGRAIRVSKVDVQGAVAGGGQTVVLTVNNGRAIRRGGYVVGVNGQGILDLAGNNLTENYYTPFPQLGGQSLPTYLAQVGTDGRGSTAPLQYVPPGQVRAASLFRRYLAAGFRTRPVQV